MFHKGPIGGSGFVAFRVLRGPQGPAREKSPHSDAQLPLFWGVRRVLGIALRTRVCACDSVEGRALPAPPRIKSREQG